MKLDESSYTKSGLNLEKTENHIVNKSTNQNFPVPVPEDKDFMSFRDNNLAFNPQPSRKRKALDVMNTPEKEEISNIDDKSQSSKSEKKKQIEEEKNLPVVEEAFENDKGKKDKKPTVLDDTACIFEREDFPSQVRDFSCLEFELSGTVSKYRELIKKL